MNKVEKFSLILFMTLVHIPAEFLNTNTKETISFIFFTVLVGVLFILADEASK